MFWITGTRLVAPKVEESYCISVQLAVVEAVCFYTTFLPNRSDERQRSGRIKAAGRWFESGRCVGP